MIYERILKRALGNCTISTGDSILAVCAGTLEREVFLGFGFTDVTISNLDEQYSSALAPYRWSHQDAERLDFKDNSFDIVFVHAGLHHCHSPHRGLLEMYRVARRMVIVIEARDSALLNIAKRFGLATDYEIEAVSSANFQSGGVRNGPIPNYIYRWTENEVLKVIRSFEPRYLPKVDFYYGLRLPYQRFRSTPRQFLRALLNCVGPMVKILSKILPKQGNEFGFTILKGGVLMPWLREEEDGSIVVSKTVVQEMGRVYKRAD
jgi:SAM-dependent methyltransferase